MKPLLLIIFAFAASLQAAPPKPYHLELEANPAAPFPFLGKFGTITLHVYPGGVRAETLLLNGFSRNGASTITVENPYTRMYTLEPIAGIAPTLRTLGSIDAAASV